jgi:hypothetical protein
MQLLPKKNENADRQYYVYAWFNNDWQTYFYVGKGKGNRYKETKGRSIPFTKIIENWDCEPIMLEENLTEEEAFCSEDVAKEAFIMEGYPIIDLEKDFVNKKLIRIGIETLKAKNNGKGIGRPKIEFPDNFKDIYKKWKAGEITAVKAMELLDLKKNTFYRLVNDYEKSLEITKEAV